MPGIATVAAVTRDRPESLRRCLVSYIENCRRHGRASDFVVADDAASAAGREATRRTLRSLKEQYGVAIYYAGLEEKRAFAEALVRGGDVPAEVVEFALFDLEGTGCTIGANRNALLLHTAGDMFLSVDDDTVCQLASVPAASEQVSLSSELDPTKFWFYRDREEALGAAAFVDRDVLQLHEQLLGRSLGECVGRDFAPVVSVGRGAVLPVLPARHPFSAAQAFTQDARGHGARRAALPVGRRARRFQPPLPVHPPVRLSGHAGRGGAAGPLVRGGRGASDGARGLNRRRPSANDRRRL